MTKNCTVENINCPKCERRLNSAGKDWWCCTVCGDVFPKLQTPPVVRRDRLAQPPKPEQWRGSEAQLVEAIREAVTARGWRVYRVGQHVVKGSGSDAGVPDLTCILPQRPPYPAIIKLLEVKVAPNKPTAEQQEIIDIGGAYAVYSVLEALEALGESR